MDYNGHENPSAFAMPAHLNSSLTLKVGKVLQVLAQMGDSIQAP